MLEELSMASLKVGLRMNISKTKVMTNSTEIRLTVMGWTVEYVAEYIYLGQLVSLENSQAKEIDRRIENAWKSYWSMKAYMKGDLPLNLKRKLLDMCILPVLTYAMERSVLGIRRTDRVRNTTIRSQTGITDISKKTAKLKWEWAGHVSRMHPGRWSQVITQWLPKGGNRLRGRPRKRWRDDLDKGLEVDWATLHHAGPVRIGGGVL
ncbi:hypothetical protein ABMA28_017178 [Loxostege sticticalis]|uniref:Endonuclease-reverse transcriptase n=1 Tax=Loxostege sticticalis TaxID=481309 RepID=A0ABD0S3L2_LOXSC